MIFHTLCPFIYLQPHFFKYTLHFPIIRTLLVTQFYNFNKRYLCPFFQIVGLLSTMKNWFKPLLFYSQLVHLSSQHQFVIFTYLCDLFPSYHRLINWLDFVMTSYMHINISVFYRLMMI